MASFPRTRVAVAHGQMDEGSLETVCTSRLLAQSLPLRRRCSAVHDHHRVEDRHAVGQHADRRPGGPARSGSAALRSGKSRVGLEEPTGPTPTCSTRRTASSRSRPTSASRTIGEHTELGSGFKIAMRPTSRDQRGGQPLGLGPVRPHRRRRLRTSTCSWWPKRWRRPGVSAAASAAHDLHRRPGDEHLPADYVGGRRRPGSRHTAASASARPPWPTWTDDIGTEWARPLRPPPRRGRRLSWRNWPGAAAAGAGPRIGEGDREPAQAGWRPPTHGAGLPGEVGGQRPGATPAAAGSRRHLL